MTIDKLNKRKRFGWYHLILLFFRADFRGSFLSCGSQQHEGAHHDRGESH